MSDLYSVISGIQPDQQDIVEAELLAKQILEANFQDIDLREGTGIRDLVLRPSAFILALCKKGFDFYFYQNSINNVDDTTPTEFVDGLMSNLFLTRNQGTLAVINARLYFAKNTTTINLYTNTSFSTDGNLLFYPQQAMTILGTDPSVHYDSYLQEYYIDIDLAAADKGTDYNIGSGSLLYFSNFNPYFLHAEINYLSQASTNPETNAQFIARASSSISTRNLVNKPSIDNVLRQQFNYITRIATIGAGDPEMYRDQAALGGNVSTPVIPTTVTLADISSGNYTKLLVDTGSFVHGLTVGQPVTITEVPSGGSSVTQTLHNRLVSDVPTTTSFKVLLPASIPSRTLGSFKYYPVLPDLYAHMGGAVDIHCIDQLFYRDHTYTLDSNGRCVVTGPVFSIIRASDRSADTVTAGASFTITFENYVSRNDVTYSQSISNVLTMTVENHPFTIGRIVEVRGWPNSASIIHLMVTQVIDENSVILGENLPTYTVSSPVPAVRYVDPQLDTGFSDRQKLTVDFTNTYAGGIASLTLGQFGFNKQDAISYVQSFLDSSDNRVVCADYMARGFDFYYVGISLYAYESPAPTTAQLATIITEFFNAMAPGQTLIVSDLIAHITASGITKFQTPTLSYSYYTKDMFLAETGNIVNFLKPLNSTSIFVLDVGNMATNVISI